MGKTDQPERATVTIPRETFDVLAGLESVLPPSKAELVTVLVRWFDTLPPDVQSAFVDPRRDPNAELAKRWLAQTDMSGVSFDDAVKQAKSAVDRLATIGAAYQEQLGVKGAGKKKS